MTTNSLSMKRVIITILLIAIASSLSAEVVRERVYISTDKQSYVAGERVWMSGFSFKLTDEMRASSDISSLVYIELYAGSKSVASVKMAMRNGRGSAFAELPLSLATGVYKIIAYTSYMQNEKPLPYFERDIAVFNTLTSERLPGVKTGRHDGILSASALNDQSDGPYPIEVIMPNNGNLAKESSYKWEINNRLKQSISASISIFRLDSLPSVDNRNIELQIKDNLFPRSSSFEGGFIPEYEGEIIRGKVVCANGHKESSLSDIPVFMSVPGGDGEIYTAVSGKDGELSFYTDNIYGKRECIMEVLPRDTTLKYTVELFDSFLHPQIEPAEQFVLDPSFSSSLRSRGFGMQVMKRFGSDSLYEVSVPKHNPFLGGRHKLYLLDDYTRFPVMEEVITEYVSELRYRKNDNNVQLMVRWDDSFSTVAYSRDNSLALIDGIPVFDHKKILEFDPLKVRSLALYSDRYYLGNISFTGIASFKTYTGKYQGLTFDKNVRIVDFEGAKPITRLTGKEFEKGLNPDFRHTIFWDPIAEIPSKGTSSYYLRTPSESGRYKLVIEGLSENGDPLFISEIFYVK